MQRGTEQGRVRVSFCSWCWWLIRWRSMRQVRIMVPCSHPQKICARMSCQSLWLHVFCVSSLRDKYSVCFEKLLYPGKVSIPWGVRTHVPESDGEWEWEFLHECCCICWVCSQEDTYSQPSLFFGYWWDGRRRGGKWGEDEEEGMDGRKMKMMEANKWSRFVWSSVSSRKLKQSSRDIDQSDSATLILKNGGNGRKADAFARRLNTETWLIATKFNKKTL